MMTVIRGLLTSVVLVGAAVGLAGPAYAELDPGNYTNISIGGMFGGIKSPWLITACGPDCLTVLYPNGTTVNYRLQGATWTGDDPECLRTIDNNSLAVRVDCHDEFGPANSQLTKDG